MIKFYVFMLMAAIWIAPHNSMEVGKLAALASIGFAVFFWLVDALLSWRGGRRKTPR